MIDIIEAFAASPPLLFLASTLIGLCVGSFLNVVIHRLPIMLERQWTASCAEHLGHTPPDIDEFNLSKPASRCPNCGHRIRFWENIPILSWLALRGKCSGCASRISARYPIVEVATAVATTIVAWHLGATVAMLAACVLTWALIALTMIDYDTQLLPDDITLPLLWLGLFANLFGLFTTLESALIGAIAGYLSLWVVFQLFLRLTGKEGMGYGDFKLLAALGAWLGWQSLFEIVLLSSLVGAVVGGLLMLTGKQDSNKPMPFGPFLAAAGWISLIWGDSLRSAYFSWMGMV